MGQRRRALSGLNFPLGKYAVAHWSHYDLMHLANNAAVSTWVDRLRGAVAYQGTGANQPTYKTGQLGGHAAIYCQNQHWLRVVDMKDLGSILNPDANVGTANSLTALSTAVAAQTGAIGAREYTIIVVCQGDGTASSRANPAVLGNANGSSSGALWANFSNGNSGRDTGTKNSVPIPAANTGLQVIVMTQPRHMGATGSVTEQLAGTYVNGTRVPKHQATSGCVSFGGYDILIGSGTNTQTSACRGYIYDVIILNKEANWKEVIGITKWAFDKHSQAYPWAGIAYFMVTSGDSIDDATGVSNMTDGYQYLIAQGGAGYSLGMVPGNWGTAAGSGYTLGANEYFCGKHVDGLSGALGGVPLLFLHHSYRNDGNLGTVYTTTIGNFFTRRKTASPGMKCVFMTPSAFTPDPANRNTFTANIDANVPSSLDGYVRVHNNATIGPDGSYTTNPTYYNADNVHLSLLGYTIIATFTGAVCQAIIAGTPGLQTSNC